MYPTPHTVQRLAWTAGTEDAHGNTADTYAPAVDVPVYGWSVPMSEEPNRHERVVVDVKVYAPPETDIKPKDKVVLPTGPNAGTYHVQGEVEDYNHGPFGFRPGVVVNLQRVEG